MEVNGQMDFTIQLIKRTTALIPVKYDLGSKVKA